MLQQDSEAVTALAFSPNGKHLFSGMRSLQQKWWDVEQGTCLRSWKVAPHHQLVLTLEPHLSPWASATAACLGSYIIAR